MSRQAPNHLHDTVGKIPAESRRLTAMSRQEPSVPRSSSSGAFPGPFKHLPNEFHRLNPALLAAEFACSLQDAKLDTHVGGSNEKRNDHNASLNHVGVGYRVEPPEGFADVDDNRQKQRHAILVHVPIRDDWDQSPAGPLLSDDVGLERADWEDEQADDHRRIAEAISNHIREGVPLPCHGQTPDPRGHP